MDHLAQTLTFHHLIRKKYQRLCQANNVCEALCACLCLAVQTSHSIHQDDDPKCHSDRESADQREPKATLDTFTDRPIFQYAVPVDAEALAVQVETHVRMLPAQVMLHWCAVSGKGLNPTLPVEVVKKNRHLSCQAGARASGPGIGSCVTMLQEQV